MTNPKWVDLIGIDPEWPVNDAHATLQARVSAVEALAYMGGTGERDPYILGRDAMLAHVKALLAGCYEKGD